MNTTIRLSVEVACPAKVWVRVGQAVREGLPAPDSVGVPADYAQVHLSLDRADDLDAWAEFLHDAAGKGFVPNAHVHTRTDGSLSWHYDADGYWLGRSVRLKVIHDIPTGADLAVTDR